jgi:small subunit ribosomal protein S20
MAHKKQAKKRIKQNEKRRKANRDLKSAIRTYSRNVAEAVARNDRAAAEEALNFACQKLDKAAKRNAFHPNNAARKKSRLAKQVNSLPK